MIHSLVEGGDKERDLLRMLEKRAEAQANEGAEGQTGEGAGPDLELDAHVGALLADQFKEAEISHSGSLHSPYLEVSKSSKKEQLIDSSPNEDDYYRIATENSLISQWRTGAREVILVRYRQEFISGNKLISEASIPYIISPLGLLLFHSLSIMTRIVP